MQTCRTGGAHDGASVVPIAFSRISWNLSTDVVSAMLIAESKLSDRILQVDADVCWRTLTYADVCWHMLTYADVY